MIRSESIVPRGLSAAGKRMLIASEPDDVTGREGVGIELTNGGHYTVARKLRDMGLGQLQGPGGPLRGMYWNYDTGLAVRAALLERLRQ